MLDRRRKIVQSTQPVLQEQGQTITRVFYRHLREEHPELAPMFNARDQSDGSQARRLAGANSRLYGNLQEAEAEASHRRRHVARLFWGILVKRYDVNV
jgi:hemoglobin-like flavoprotein